MIAWLWLAVATALLVATWAHYAFWSRFYFLPTGEDEVIHVETADGWRLGLARRRPRAQRRGLPVLLVHGLAANHVSLDFGWERWSLSAYLSQAGFDCFALDLRGHGLSRRKPPGGSRQWTFDDYVRLDVPAALDAIREATGEERVLWVGHSQGGLIGLASCSVHRDRVAALVTLGSPAFFTMHFQAGAFLRLALFLIGRLNRFLAHALAPFTGYWHLPVTEVAINGKNVTGPVYRRLLVNVVENTTPGVLGEWAKWIATDTFASLDGAVDYRAGMARARQPALFVAAVADRLAPPEVVERAARTWGGESTLLRVGLAGHACCDYGHTDLIFGPRAPEEVFAPVRDWLVTHASGAPAGAPPPAARKQREGQPA